MNTIELGSLSAGEIAAWERMKETAAELDLRPRMLFEGNGEYAVQLIWQPNPTYEKWFLTYFWPSVEELIEGVTNVLEDSDIMNIFKAGDLFKYLVAEMLPDGRDVTMTIARAEVEMLKNQRGEQERVVLHFKETDKGFVVGNKTNVRQLVKLMGPETDNWKGQRIMLYKTKVAAFGQQVDAIRVREKLAPAAKGKVNGHAPAEDPAVTDPAESLPAAESEEIPFEV
jgi:hypothetical protein